MVLHIHPDAVYLSEARAYNRVAGYYFIGEVPQKGRHTSLNGSMFNMCGIIKFVVASVAEAKLGDLFMNIKDEK
jgi:hypothetical protein